MPNIEFPQKRLVILSDDMCAQIDAACDLAFADAYKAGKNDVSLNVRAERMAAIRKEIYERKECRFCDFQEFVKLAYGLVVNEATDVINS